MSDCIFCGIAAGTMPAERVHEDERTVAFLDIFPAADGHVLVIPRAHADDIHSADPADLAACARTAQLMAGRVSGALGCDGVTIIAGQRRAPPGRPSSTTTCTSSRASTATASCGRGRPGKASPEELARTGALLRGE